MSFNRKMENEQKVRMNNAETDIGFLPTQSDNSSDDFVKSDSKIPLKTTINDGGSDIQVKFSINDSANGKGKCIAQKALPSFSGLSKEELLKFANDPFWVRMRLFLFIFFWLVWIAMFVGAIAIIIMAPKCEPPKKPDWFEQGPLYEIDIMKFAEKKDSESYLQSLKSKLGYLADLNIKGLILSPIFQSDEENEENVVDFKSVDFNLGTMEDFREFLTESKEKGIYTILSFVPNHSSIKHIWFNKSVSKVDGFDDYYIWKSASGINADGSKKPPNNWLSVTGGSAWEWVESRQEFYLHQFNVNQPDLNYHNPSVVRELKEIMNFWLDLGVYGFNLDKVQYLLEDTSFQDEIPGGKPGAIHTQYEFYLHKKSHNIPEVANLLSSWRKTIHDKTSGNGVLIVTGDIPTPADSNASTVVVDIIRSDKLLKNLTKNFSAKDLYPQLQKIIDSSEKWPSVQLGNRFMSRVADIFEESSVDGLNMITLLLPATPVTYFGEELGLSDQTPFQWGNETNGVLFQKEAKESHYKVYQALVKARDTQTILYGNSNLKVINDSVLVFTRIHMGSPGYLFAYNPSPQNLTVDLSNLEFIPNDLMIYTKSVNFPLEVAGANKVKSKNLFLPSKSAAVYTFAPKVE